ncbi:hypothetical protein KSP40_PGU020436 [Platanthera guangdongensis]|uniref:30S ribosomal protein S7, chloroplastic n=1 Tax=Platanthera guangdongensis TaxID=2320717 RepID=A0ABR2MGB4_9ASPA
MPLGTAIHNIEITLGKGGQLARAAGAVAKLIAKEGKSATLRLPNPLSVLRQAIRVVTPDIAVKARRVGGSTHQVPIEIGSTQGKALAIRWLLGASRKRPGRNMAFQLSSELVDAAKGSGDAIRKKEETHRMAEANRAFAHFR